MVFSVGTNDGSVGPSILTCTAEHEYGLLASKFLNKIAFYMDMGLFSMRVDTLKGLSVYQPKFYDHHQQLGFNGQKMFNSIRYASLGKHY